MATYTDLAGADVKNFKIQKGNTLSFPFSMTQDSVAVNFADSTLVFECYRGNYSTIFTITDGVLSDDELTITFETDITLAIGTYKYRVLRTSGGVTLTAIYGKLKIY